MRLPLPDADVFYFERFFSAAESDRYFAVLEAQTPWSRETLKLFGRQVEMPRLIAWYGDPGRSYSYSGLRHDPLPWTPALLEIKRRVEAAAGASFNGALLNLYRSGQDSMGWHSDDEPELGPEPVIASVSFGSARVFRLKHRTRPDVARVDLPLTHGSLLIMRGATQRCWRHSVPKTAKPRPARVNLTFRAVL